MTDTGAKRIDLSFLDDDKKKLKDAVTAAILKIGPGADFEKVRNEVVLTQKINAGRAELKQAFHEVAKQSNGKAGVNALSNLEQYRLNTFVDSQRDFLRGKSLDEILAECRQKLPDVFITENNVYATCKMFGVEYKKKRKAGGRGPDSTPRGVRYKELAGRVSKLEADLANLKAQLGAN